MSSSKKALLLSDTMLLTLAVVWGTSYGVVKSALCFYPVVGLLALRFGITFLILSPALRHLSCLPVQKVLQLISTGLLLLAIFLSESFGLIYTTASNAAFLISLCVILTPLVEWCWLKRQPGAREWLAVACSAGGALLISQNSQWQLNPGDGLILLAALLRAVQICLLKSVTQHCQIPALTVTALQSGVVALGCILLAHFTLTSPVQDLINMADPGRFWGYLLYLVLACTLFAFFVQNYAIQRSNPTRVSLLMGSEPLFGAIFAMLWLNEAISAQSWLGGLMIVAACLLASLPRSPLRPQTASSTD